VNLKEGINSSNRRQLLKMVSWLLPFLATARLSSQTPTTQEKDGLVPLGNPFVGGFLTGNDFRRLSEAEKTAYLMGVWDGYLYAPAIGGKSENDQVLKECIPGLQSDQLLAIVNKYVRENPEQWGGPMNEIVFAALPKECRNLAY